MKSIQITSKKKEKNPYPCLKQSQVTDTVVLFTQPKVGIIIYVPKERDKHYFLGYQSNCWSEEEDFIDYPHEIKLSN